MQICQSADDYNHTLIASGWLDSEGDNENGSFLSLEEEPSDALPSIELDRQRTCFCCFSSVDNF